MLFHGILTFVLEYVFVVNIPWEKPKYCGRESSILKSERFSQGGVIKIKTNCSIVQTTHCPIMAFQTLLKSPKALIPTSFTNYTIPRQKSHFENILSVL